MIGHPIKLEDEAMPELPQGAALPWELRLHLEACERGERDMERLRAEWGDQFDARIKLARDAVRVFGLGLLGQPRQMRIDYDLAGGRDSRDKVVADMLSKVEDVLGTYAFIRWFAAIGEKFRDDHRKAA